MKKLIEMFAIEVSQTANGEPKMVWTGRDDYPSVETIEVVLAAHNAKFANVRKLYRLEDEHE